MWGPCVVCVNVPMVALGRLKRTEWSPAVHGTCWFIRYCTVATVYYPPADPSSGFMLTDSVLSVSNQAVNSCPSQQTAVKTDRKHVTRDTFRHLRSNNPSSRSAMFTKKRDVVCVCVFTVCYAEVTKISSTAIYTVQVQWVQVQRYTLCHRKSKY